MTTWKQKQIKARDEKQINITYMILVLIGLVVNFVMILNILKTM